RRCAARIWWDVDVVKAGVFPYEGIYVCALRAADGAVIWKNDTVSDRVYELEFGGISPHGYLLASKDRLYVPSGRAMPAAFDRQTGEFLFYASPGGHRGGVWAVLDGDRLIAGTVFSESQGMIWLGYPRIRKTDSVYNAYPNYGLRFDMNKASPSAFPAAVPADSNIGFHFDDSSQLSFSCLLVKRFGKFAWMVPSVNGTKLSLVLSLTPTIVASLHFTAVSPQSSHSAIPVPRFPCSRRPVRRSPAGH
ncbi:MAG: hypothetical protein ACC645_26060, partial [Pirellulales bacterium]